jgi:hypothetical protein
MKNFSLYCLLFALLLSSCSKGVFVTIDNKKYNYGKNTIVTFTNWQGTPPGYGLQIRTFKKSDNDSAFFSLSVGKSNIPITAGDYSFPNVDRTNLSTSSISFYDNNRNRYVSGGDEIYGPTFIITSLTKKRAKGYFKSRLVDTKADTAKPSNTIYVEGRFNVSLKNAQHQ